MRTVYPAAAVGFLIGGTASVLQAGWTDTFIGAAFTATVLASLLLIRKLWLANRQVNQIFDDETGGSPDHEGLGPKDFAMDLIPENHKPTDTGETR